MAVLSVTTLTVKPDRMGDFVEQARKAKAILEKHGGRNCRLISGVVAGEATGAFVFTVEADDFAGMGAVQDKVMTDPDAAAIMTLGTANPAAGYQISYWVDIPL